MSIPGSASTNRMYLIDGSDMNKMIVVFLLTLVSADPLTCIVTLGSVSSDQN